MKYILNVHLAYKCKSGTALKMSLWGRFVASIRIDRKVQVEENSLSAKEAHSQATSECIQEPTSL